MSTQQEKAQAFRALHERPGAFIVPNPWDVGSARILAHLGFEALATTSMGYAFSLGRQDNTLNRAETLAHASAIVPATRLPVSADLENGFADDPKVVAETIRFAAATGVVGGSIEDATGCPDDPIYEIEHAVERVQAAAETARAENYLHGRRDLGDTIRRLQAFQEAGADVLYAPGLATTDDIATVVSSVDRPVNVVMGLEGAQLSLAELAAIGVRRISVGSALYRTALGAALRAAREMRELGTFAFAKEAVPSREVSPLFGSLR